MRVIPALSSTAVALVALTIAGCAQPRHTGQVLFLDRDPWPTTAPSVPEPAVRESNHALVVHARVLSAPPKVLLEHGLIDGQGRPRVATGEQLNAWTRRDDIEERPLPDASQYAGQYAAWSAHQQFAFIADYEVAMTDGRAALDPVIKTMNLGKAFASRAYVAGDNLVLDRLDLRMCTMLDTHAAYGSPSKGLPGLEGPADTRFPVEIPTLVLARAELPGDTFHLPRGKHLVLPLRYRLEMPIPSGLLLLQDHDLRLCRRGVDITQGVLVVSVEVEKLPKPVPVSDLPQAKPMPSFPYATGDAIPVMKVPAKHMLKVPRKWHRQ